MKILITGKKGQLGRALFQQLRQDHEVKTTDRNELDICDEKSVNKFISNVAPDVIINAAAYTAVDLAETEVNNCWAVNALPEAKYGITPPDWKEELNSVFSHIDF